MANNIKGSLATKYGTYYAVISLKDINGKRKQKWIPTGLKIKGNKKKATDFLNFKIQEFESLHLEYYVDITAANYFKMWLEQIKGDVKPNTYRTYVGNMENHIIPYFTSKKIKLQELKPKDITEYYNYLKAHTQLSTTTIKHHHQNISKALSDAVALGYIAVNPSTAARTPKEKKYQAEFLNSSQIEQLLELFECTSVYVPIVLCSIYGFRRSEVLGLKWRNIDFEKGTIHICETLQQSTKKISGETNYTDSTKTDGSDRTLPITRRVKKLLLEQRKIQQSNKCFLGAGYVSNDYVCTFDNGKEISPNYLSKTFHRIICKSDLPQIRLHDLRHSVASNLLNDGFTVVQVAEWLGHSSSNTTLKFYAHNDKTSKMAIADRLDGV